MSPTNTDLGEMDSAEDFNVPATERKIYTEAYDLSLQTLHEQWENKILRLPVTQREYLWDNAKASRLIESLLLSIPIPILYFAQTQDAHFEIYDGHQRVRSVVRFFNNEFRLTGLALLSHFKGMRYRDLPKREQRFLRMRMMRAVVILDESHSNMKFEVFERLNTGSISLNAQELRNSMFRGSFNDLLGELENEACFRDLMGRAKPRRRMVDRELILRFFALRDNFHSYRPPLKRFMNKYMGSLKDAAPDVLSRLRTTFTRTITVMSSCLGSSAFRLANADGTLIEKTVNRALFEAQMLAFSWITCPAIDVPSRAIFSALADAYDSEEFLDAIRRATGDRSRMRLRVRTVAQALDAAGLPMEVPAGLSE